MLGLPNIRLYGYLAVILVTLGMGLAIKYLNGQLKATKAANAELVMERDQAREDFLAYKEAKVKDELLNRRTREVLQERLTAIERTRAAVSVRCYAASVPSAAAASGATAGADAAAVNGSAGTALQDIGPALEDARIEALKNNSNYMGLQEWERNRR